MTPRGKKAIYMQHGINAGAYVPVGLQPERGKVGHECCSLVKGTKTPTIKALYVERPPCGATIVRACQSVETLSSRLSPTQISRSATLACQIALIEAPKGDGEPPARARNDSMVGSESRFLGNITWERSVRRMDVDGQRLGVVVAGGASTTLGKEEKPRQLLSASLCVHCPLV